METALHSFLVSVPQAAALWLLMLVGVIAAAMLLARTRQPARPAPLTEAEADALRYAGEVAVAADRAALTAERRRAEWTAAQEELDAAWRAYDEADRMAREVAKACAYPLMSRRRKPGENIERQRYLHHAATEACRQRQLSIAQLNDVFAHRGWNPRLHPVVQEAALRQAVRENRLAGYRAAQERERLTWHEAEAAAEALRSLRIEAAAAATTTRVDAGQPVADERWWADQWTTAELPAAA
ncbi:hypothetical protein [Paractinoplanes rishiriensis]|uniref:Uncharacterized protein n=1 Tax=Paractinoplanes rishiriensis TaxID=1050105 RepID=A0A919MS49_9ACTN|nr:hypothetical protein [Actinoplanes rishiriensis]GIE92859.1 hypothetical protein Ari01nite_03240 [Actinoplanes rishiriensis]